MNVFGKITWRTLKRNRARTVITIVGVILAAAMLTAVTAFAVSLQQFLVVSEEESGGNWHLLVENVSSETAGELAEASGVEAAMVLVQAAWNEKAPVRALTITAQNLVEEGDAGEQINLFAADAAPRRDKLEKLEKAMDGIRDKYGRAAISSASNLRRGDRRPIPPGPPEEIKPSERTPDPSK